MPDTYRNIYPKSVKNIGKRYAKDASKKINNIAAFITEPILGCGGQVPLPMDYLKIMYDNDHLLKLKDFLKRKKKLI